MLDNRYLLYGLNALSRAHKFNYFLDGHRGGAIVSGVYLCRQNEVEAGVPAIVAHLIDDHWAHTELCAPFPDEASESRLLDRIVDCMAANMEGMRQAGHNVILPTLALKAFLELPTAITPERVDGVCRSEARGHFEFGSGNVDGHDPPRAGDARPLDGAEANTPTTMHCYPFFSL